MNEVFITVKDFLQMAREFDGKKMDFVVVGMKENKAGKSVVSFSATRDDIDYEINYTYEEK